ncbi:MAG TPA: PepSY domain-containing protein [Candidatus Saccharibacteria bacterium]|nr:PepSY domain-containing protein [Candidatus Saccharibacteria bacterium]HRK94057.1 PepSY domain-containing protein [Candidatus Saccharibacteria bacterium]
MSNIPKDLEKKLSSAAAEIDPQFKQQLKNNLFKEKKMSIPTLIRRILRYVRTAPALAVLAALVIVGSTSAFVATNQAHTARDAEIEVPANLDDLLSFDEVRALAIKDMPNGVITGIELEKEDNGMVYKVKFADGTVRIYDAKTGEAVTKSGSESDDSVPSSFNAGITAEKARQIALDQRPGKTITKIELETEHGTVVYSVRFSDGGRVDVDASNGAVLRVRGASSSGSSGRSSDDDSQDDSDSDSSSDDENDDSNDDKSGEDSDSDSGSDDGEDDNSGSGSGR